VKSPVRLPSRFLTIRGSQDGSQRAQVPGTVGRRLANVTAGQSRTWRQEAPLSDPASVYGMQEVWGSNPHSSTSQFKAINSNKAHPSRPVDRSPRRNPSSWVFGINAQVNGVTATCTALKFDLLHCRQAAVNEPLARRRSGRLFDTEIRREPAWEPTACAPMAGRPPARRRTLPLGRRRTCEERYLPRS
jgi:hypothetical protein